MLKSSLCCDYSDEYILAKGTIFIAPEAGANPNSKDKEDYWEIVLYLVITYVK